MSDYIKLCANCKQTKSKEYPTLSGFYDVFKIPSDNVCYFCGNQLTDSIITEEEFKILKKISQDDNFLLAMIDLKEKEPIEYQLKMSQFKASVSTQEQVEKQLDNRPKCPTCGSLDLSKVSTMSKTGSVFMWGLLSQKVKKTWHCNNCKYEW